LLISFCLPHRNHPDFFIRFGGGNHHHILAQHPQRNEPLLSVIKAAILEGYGTIFAFIQP
jgi:hypothetical protein